MITYDTFADAQNDPLLVKEGQVILTLGHVTKNDGKGRHWILEDTDKDFAYKNKTETMFLNRLIKADEVQIGHLYPLAGNETAPPETVKPTGQIANRANFKRVWAWAQATGRVVTEAEWSANPGCFSSGDLSTTFRFPLAKDFIRAKESGRNVGSFQADRTNTLADVSYATTYPPNSITVPKSEWSGYVLAGEEPGGGPEAGMRFRNSGEETYPRNIAQQYFMKI